MQAWQTVQSAHRFIIIALLNRSLQSRSAPRGISQQSLSFFTLTFFISATPSSQLPLQLDARHRPPSPLSFSVVQI
jgi:hypothetical protein